MKKLVFLLILVLVPSLFAKCSVKNAQQQFKRSVYEFSTSLLTKIAQENENHFVTSTLSAWTLLASTSLGATGPTLGELKEVLHLKGQECYNRILKIASNITSDNINTDVVFNRTSNIYADEELKILKKFKNSLKKNGLSEIKNISFKDGDSAAQIINDYVNHATHGTIDKIVSSEDFENILMILIDAVYFKGSWQFPFQPNDTTVSPFYDETGTQIGEVNFMYLFNSFKIRSIDNINADVIELPYGNDYRYSMLIFLPFAHTPLYSVIENLKKISLTTIYKMFEEFGEEDITLQIPRFKITSDLTNLKDLLIDMGLKTMFNSSEAQFPLISHSHLYVSKLKQKAYIEVTEEGTVASAATDAGFGFKSLPEEFIANKPFLFMIVDKKLEIPIFTGAYSKPSLF